MKLYTLFLIDNTKWGGKSKSINFAEFTSNVTSLIGIYFLDSTNNLVSTFGRWNCLSYQPFSNCNIYWMDACLIFTLNERKRKKEKKGEREREREGSSFVMSHISAVWLYTLHLFFCFYVCIFCILFSLSLYVFFLFLIYVNILLFLSSFVYF